MTGNIVFENNRGKVYDIGGNTYEVYRHGTRNLDGMMDTGLQYLATYAPHYTRDWLGRTQSIYWDYDPLAAAMGDLA